MTAWCRLCRNLFSHWEYIPAGATMPIDETALVKVRYRAAGTSNAVSEDFTASTLAIDLTPTFAENIVPGSIHFTLGGKPTSTAWAASITT